MLMSHFRVAGAGFTVMLNLTVEVGGGGMT